VSAVEVRSARMIDCVASVPLAVRLTCWSEHPHCEAEVELLAAARFVMLPGQRNRDSEHAHSEHAHSEQGESERRAEEGISISAICSCALAQ